MYPLMYPLSQAHPGAGQGTTGPLLPDMIDPTPSSTPPKNDLRILSWNVNGVRACARKGLIPWLDDCEADIVGLQEVRATAEQMPPGLRRPHNWHRYLAAAERPGYSGVGLLSRQAADEVITELGVAEFDAEGRLQVARFGPLIVANVYFPNGSGKGRDNSRVPFKLAFYQRLFDHLQPHVAAGLPVLVMGDFNTAHLPIDLARPKGNTGTSGFLAEERAELDRWLAAGWVDSWRHLHPDTPGGYSWWAQRGGCRSRNVGWRIDMIYLSPAALPHLRDAFILPEVMGSDHCPIGVDLDPAILGADGAG